MFLNTSKIFIKSYLKPTFFQNNGYTCKQSYDEL